MKYKTYRLYIEPTKNYDKRLIYLVTTDTNYYLYLGGKFLKLTTLQISENIIETHDNPFKKSGTKIILENPFQSSPKIDLDSENSIFAEMIIGTFDDFLLENFKKAEPISSFSHFDWAPNNSRTNSIDSIS